HGPPLTPFEQADDAVGEPDEADLGEVGGARLGAGPLDAEGAPAGPVAVVEPFGQLVVHGGQSRDVPPQSLVLVAHACRASVVSGVAGPAGSAPVYSLAYRAAVARTGAKSTSRARAVARSTSRRHRSRWSSRSGR